VSLRTLQLVSNKSIGKHSSSKQTTKEEELLFENNKVEMSTK